MKKELFDDYADAYENILHQQLSFFEKDTDYFAEYKTDLVSQSAVGKPQKILEFGCGTGRNLIFLKRNFPASRIYGCDISSKSLEVAARHNPEAVLFQSGKNKAPYNDHFDLILVACVLHHIPPELWREKFIQLRDWLKIKGEIFIFEHNPYNPVTRRLVSSCPYDKGAVLLRPKEVASLLEGVGFRIIERRYVLFFPSLLRKLRFLEKKMAFIPLGGQYFLHAIK